jgi:hypothetical protein
MPTALAEAGANLPEDIAGLTPAELAELLEPHSFSDEELQDTIKKAKGQLALCNLSRSQRQHLLPDKAAAPIAAEAEEGFWLARASKIKKRKAAAQPSTRDVMQAESAKASRAAKKLVTTILPAMKWSPARAISVESS